MESGHEPNGDWVNNWIEVDTYLVNIIVYLMSTSMLSDIIEIYMFRICLFWSSKSLIKEALFRQDRHHLPFAAMH